MIGRRGTGGRMPLNQVRGGPGSARVVDLYLRDGCHLCEEARRVVLAVAADSGAPVREHDVDADASLRERYGELVPVVLVNGEPHAQWRVDPERLRAALRPSVGFRRGGGSTRQDRREGGLDERELDPGE